MKHAQVVRDPLAERRAPRPVEGDGGPGRPEDRDRDQAADGPPEDALKLPSEVVEEFKTIEEKFRKNHRNGQISIEVHYNDGERMKLWVREGAVFKP